MIHSEKKPDVAMKVAKAGIIMPIDSYYGDGNSK